MKNHLRRFANLKGMLIKLILIKNTAYSTNHLCAVHAKKRSYTATSSASKINHYHCPYCSITVKQKSNFLSHIAKHDYKNENINSKEGETPTEPLYTDNDIREEK